MAQKDILSRTVETGRDMSQKTQDRLEALVSDLVKRSEQQAEQARDVLQELLDRSKATSEQLVETVDREVRTQIANLGLATKADIKRLEDKIEKLSAGGATKKRSSAKRSSTKKRSSKKAAAKRSSSS